MSLASSAQTSAAGIDASFSMTAAEVAALLGGEVTGDPLRRVNGVNTLEKATESDLTLVAQPKYVAAWRSSKARVALVTKSIMDAALDDRTIVFVDDAEVAMIRILEACAPAPDIPEVGIDSTAAVDPSAAIGKGSRIGPHVSVGKGARIGDGVVLHAGVRVYADAEIGDGTVIHSNCVIRERCRVGRQVILHQNVNIGADGFGYRPAPDGSGLMKVPHLGGVVIEDGVEVGAGSCIDRGKFGDTVIGAGTKIDNLVQIAHNCTIGRCCIIAATTGLAGSVTIGDGAILAGNVRVTDHVTIGSGATLAAGAGVMQDVPAGETWLGVPATNSRDALRQWAAVRKLPKVLRSISESSRPASD